MNIMPIMGNRAGRQNFTGSAVNIADLIQDLHAVEESANIPAAAVELTGKLKDLYGIREVIQTYFPQSEKLKRVFGISDKSIKKHPHYRV